LGDELAKAVPKTLRYRLMRVAARIVRSQPKINTPKPETPPATPANDQGQV